MGKQWGRVVSAGVVTLVLFAGCTPDAEKPPPEPMATDGPNQVVIYVPTMVCESCPDKVSEGLAMLPWVDAGTIHADRKARQVRFTVKDRSAFDIDAVKETITRKGFRGVQLLTGPTSG